MKHQIYLDDVRTPMDRDKWIVVRTYDQFVEVVNRIGLENIQTVSLDHDLGPQAMNEWREGVRQNYTIDYGNIGDEKTGYDAAKWLVEQWLDGKPIVQVFTHSANAVGAANIMGYINNYLHLNRFNALIDGRCEYREVPFKIEW
jgi:hypothetical protein